MRGRNERVACWHWQLPDLRLHVHDVPLLHGRVHSKQSVLNDGTAGSRVLHGLLHAHMVCLLCTGTRRTRHSQTCRSGCRRCNDYDTLVICAPINETQKNERTREPTERPTEHASPVVSHGHHPAPRRAVACMDTHSVSSMPTCLTRLLVCVAVVSTDDHLPMTSTCILPARPPSCIQ